MQAGILGEIERSKSECNYETKKIRKISQSTKGKLFQEKKKDRGGI